MWGEVGHVGVGSGARGGGRRGAWGWEVGRVGVGGGAHGGGRRGAWEWEVGHVGWGWEAGCVGVGMQGMCEVGHMRMYTAHLCGRFLYD